MHAAPQPALEHTPPPPSGEAGLERVFVQHQERVFRAAYRILGNATDAEDVLQTVFLRLLRREGGNPLSETPGSYLHRAAVNGALDLLRSRKRARTTPLEDVEPRLAEPPGRAPVDGQLGREVHERLREALGRLTPRSAEIFALRYLEGYGNKEIARMLGMGRGTVAVVLHRARKRLQEDLRPLLGDEPAPTAGPGVKP